MCGIFGYVGHPCDGLLGLALLRRRGPDGLAYWADELQRVWLGHARLSIQDISSAGDQPMYDPTRRFTMVYNGEIYNAPSLRAELEARGETFVGTSDSEVLLRLFALEGAAIFARLNGIFAAAFWDSHTQQLTLVRDAMGVKPLYIDRRDGRFAFSSEMKALLRTHDRVPTVNQAALLRHLVYLWSPGDATIAEGVTKLLPGQVLCRQADGTETTHFFADPGLPTVEKSQVDTETAAKQVAQAIEMAVERQLLSDVPVGAFLSGGLDSSSVVAFASKKLRENGQGDMPCFSIEIRGSTGEDEGITDDLPYARRVADHLGVKLHIVEVDSGIVDRLAELVYLMDEPNSDPAPLNSLLISELAREKGIKVLLSGTGGDDVFTGYRRHYALRQERYWAWLPKSARRLLRRASAMLPKSTSAGRRIAKAFAYADHPLDDRIMGYFQWLDPFRAQRLLCADNRRHDAKQTAQSPLAESLAKVPLNASALDRMLYLERRHFLADHNLNYTDKTGMAAGVEIRVPLLDPDVIALADSLPDNYRQRGHVGKWIFKRAMERFLPHDVIYRPKSGFGAPLRKWLDGPLRPLVDDIVSEKAMISRGIFDPGSVRELIFDTANGKIDATYSIFAIISVELWCRQFIDGGYALDSNVDVAALNIRRVA